MVRVLESRLLLCFNEVDLDESEVKTIMRMNRSEKTEEEAQNMLARFTTGYWRLVGYPKR